MSKDAPRVIAPPPIIFTLAFILGLAVSHGMGWRWAAKGWEWGLGGLIAAPGFALALWSAVTLLRAGTNVQTHRPVEAIVRAGPYARCRNPIYIALLAVFFGAGLIARAPGLLALTPLIALILHYGVVRPEEAYLREKFGAAYEDYAKSTPRWAVIMRAKPTPTSKRSD
ncbi:MAG: methyltransferase family protein [Maricaulaceae bacterium]